MDDREEAGLAKEAFEGARIRQIFGRLFAFARRAKSELLSLERVSGLMRPSGESYRGLRSIPLDLVAGSEERHRDFDRAFLPRRSEMASRWTRLYRAFARGVALPPISVYELGGLFFVRDGNHRVSVARAHKREFIDAEVVSLDSEMRLDPDMSVDDIKAAIADRERAAFMAAMGIPALQKGCCLRVTEPGGYDRIRRSIEEHRAGSQSKDEAFSGWCRDVCMPVQKLERRRRLTRAVAGSTVGDLLSWMLDRRPRRWRLERPRDERRQDEPPDRCLP